MNGRILAERLLATTSVAALALAVMSPEAQAACGVTVSGGSYVNNSTICGISVTGNSVSVTNGPAGLVTPGGITVQSGVTLSGAIVNAGRILTSSTSATAIAITSQGLIQGGITNSGTISAAAIIAVPTRAAAVGVAVYGSTAFSSVAASFGGSVVNSGTIVVRASSSASATAIGIGVRVSTFSGGITNSGTISVVSTAGGTRAFATGAAASVVSFSGSITNAGTIVASVTSTAGGPSAGIARGLAVQGTNALVIAAPSIGVAALLGASYGGSIVNSGTISAAATAPTAAAVGIYTAMSTFTGGITNSGTISATGLGSAFGYADGIDAAAVGFGGSIVNNGAITVTADPPGSKAVAHGIIVHGTSGGFALNPATALSFAGSVTNSGSIALSVTGRTATATGISINVATFSGNVVNSGSISATVQGRQLIADGIALFNGSYLGGITNSGSISISATVTAGAGRISATGILLCGCVSASGGIVNSGTIGINAAAGVGNAKAAGMSFNSFALSGGISNSGVLSIVATGRNAQAVGIGVGLEAGSAASFSGNLINSSTISASAAATSGSASATGVLLSVSSFTGNVTNSGTIAATSSGAANQARALVIGNTSGSVVIVNSGTLSGNASGSNIGDGIVINTGAIGPSAITNTGKIQGSLWAIDLSAAVAAPGTVINQNGGSIIGPTGVTGGAIQFSPNGDTLNINGGSITGNITDTSNTATVNVQTGAGNTFSYGSTISGILAANLNSGGLLLTNSGAATPGATVNTTTYTQAVGTVLGIQVSSTQGAPAAAGTGSVNATGLATLAGYLEAFETASYFVPGTTYNYTNVVTWGTVTGDFTAALSNSPLFAASKTQGGGSETLTLSLLPASAVPGTNSNQQSVVTAVNNIPGGNSFLDQIYTLNSSQLGPALNALAGAQFTQSDLGPLIAAWNNFSATLSNRLSIGEGYSGTMTGGYAPGSGVQFAQNAIPQQQAPASDAVPTRIGSPVKNQWGVWMRGYGLTASAPSTATSGAYNEAGAGMIVGADTALSDRLVAGIALNISTDKSNFVGGGSNLSDNYQGSVYAQYHMDENWYLNGIAGFGWQTYSSARAVQLATTSIANASYDGQSYRLYGETGYTLRPAWLRDQSLQVTPLAGLGYLHSHVSPFNETGSAAALNVQATDSNSLTTDLGFRARLVWRVGDSEFRPEIRAAWEHEWADDTATIRSAFVQGSGNVMTLTGSAFSRESFVGGAGITTAVSSSTQLFIDFDAKVNGGYVANVISGGARVDF